MPWNQNLFELKDSTYADFIYEIPDSLNPQHLTIAVAGNDESVYQRFVGCVMIGVLPEGGLHEALRTLKDMLVFYAENARYEQVTRLPPEKIQTAVIAQEIRPGIVISD
jgi:hypothetical protein